MSSTKFTPTFWALVSLFCKTDNLRTRLSVAYCYPEREDQCYSLGPRIHQARCINLSVHLQMVDSVTFVKTALEKEAMYYSFLDLHYLPNKLWFQSDKSFDRLEEKKRILRVTQKCFPTIILSFHHWTFYIICWLFQIIAVIYLTFTKRTVGEVRDTKMKKKTHKKNMWFQLLSH